MPLNTAIRGAQIEELTISGGHLIDNTLPPIKIYADNVPSSGSLLAYLGDDQFTWSEPGALIFNETPGGDMDGVNVTFTVLHDPILDSLQLYLNGLLQEPGPANDYTISGSTLTLDEPPVPNDILLATYLVASGISAGGGGVTNHGALTGLADDDHTQYLLADGSRTLSGTLLPATSGTINLGSLEYPFGSIYVDNSTLYIGGVSINDKLLVSNGTSSSNYNVLVGESTPLTEPTSTIGIGEGSLNGASNTFQSIAIGTNAGGGDTVDMSECYLIGTGCGYGSSYINSVLAIGTGAAQTMTYVNNLIAIGMHAGNGSSNNQDNIFIGLDSGLNSTGSTNICLGVYTAADGALSGYDNICIGRSAGRILGDSNYNVLIGQSAGEQLNAGSNNVALGAMAGYGAITSSSGVFIGFKAGFNETESNRLYISNSDTSSPLIYGEFDNALLRFNSKLEITGDIEDAGTTLVDIAPTFTPSVDYLQLYGIWLHPNFATPNVEGDYHCIMIDLVPTGNIAGLVNIEVTSHFSANTGFYRGVTVRNFVDSGAVVVEDAIGFNFETELGASVTIPTFMGARSYLKTADGAAITDAYQYLALIDQQGTSTITNSYLFYGSIPYTGQGTITNNWGIYISGVDKNYLAGNTTIDGDLEITGTISGSGIASFDALSDERVPYYNSASGTLLDTRFVYHEIDDGYSCELMALNMETVYKTTQNIYVQGYANNIQFVDTRSEDRYAEFYGIMSNFTVAVGDRFDALARNISATNSFDGAAGSLVSESFLFRGEVTKTENVTITDNWGIYITGADKNYLAGDMTIDGDLEVTGTISGAASLSSLSNSFIPYYNSVSGALLNSVFITSRTEDEYATSIIALRQASEFDYVEVDKENFEWLGIVMRPAILADLDIGVLFTGMRIGLDINTGSQVPTAEYYGIDSYLSSPAITTLAQGYFGNIRIIDTLGTTRTAEISSINSYISVDTTDRLEATFINNIVASNYIFASEGLIEDIYLFKAETTKDPAIVVNNNWGIYISGADKNYLDGDMTIDGDLEVTGTIAGAASFSALSDTCLPYYSSASGTVLNSIAAMNVGDNRIVIDGDLEVTGTILGAASFDALNNGYIPYYNSASGTILNSMLAVDMNIDMLIINGQITLNNGNGNMFIIDSIDLATASGLQGCVVIGDRPFYSGLEYITGNSAIVIGNEAAVNTQSINQSIIIGANAGELSINDENIIIGYRAGYGMGSSTPDGSTRNIVIGSDAGWTVGSGNNNILIGYQVGGNEVEADSYSDDIFIGRNAGEPDGTGYFNHHNIGIGELSCVNLRNAHDNVCIGRQSGGPFGDGSGNVSVGYSALFGMDITSNYNVALGYEAGSNIMNAGRDVYIGYKAGYEVVGSGNVFIGAEAGATGGLHSISNKLYIENSNSSSPLIYGDFTTDFIQINGSLEVTGGLTNTQINSNCTISGAPISGVLNLNDGYYNVVITNHAAFTISSGISDSVIIGKDALYNITGGGSIIAIGDSVGQEAQALGGAIIIGNNAGFSYNGNDDIIIGNSASYALGYNSSAHRNIVIGLNSGYSLRTGDNNILLGYEVGGNDVETGVYSNNIFIGRRAGDFWEVGTTNYYNIGVGEYACGHIRDGYNNVCIGRESGFPIGDGIGNVAMGYRALKLGYPNANYNVALGCMAGYDVGIDSSYNIYIGYQAGFETTASGNAYNIYVGYQAGAETTGSGNVFIGREAGYNADTSNKLYIENSNSSSPLIYGDFATDLVRVNGNLEVPSDKAYYLGDATVSGTWRVIRSGDDLKFQWYDGGGWNDGNVTVGRA